MAAENIEAFMSLFKYIRPERIDVIENCAIRFTQPSALNDPFELRPQFETLIAEAEALAHFQNNPIDLQAMIEQAYAMLPEAQRSLLSLETARQTITAFMETRETREATAKELLFILNLVNEQSSYLREKIYQSFNQHIGILSLSELPDNDLMWAHYADSHRGLLLCFDERHHFFNRKRMENDEFYYLRKVIYSDVAPPSSIASLDGDVLLITKGTEWDYEREWRMLAPLNDATRQLKIAEDTIHLFEFPPDALRGIVFGANASNAMKNNVQALVNNSHLSHIEVSQAILDMKTRSVKVVWPCQ